MVDSIIKLFESTSKEFTTNGIGYLSDAIKCEVTEERNGLYELEMTYPITGIRYSELRTNRIIATKSNPYSTIQGFRIYSISKPMNGVITVNAEHVSYDASGIPVKPFSADSILDAFNKMKANSMGDNPFTTWTDKTTTAKMETVMPYSFRELLGGQEGSILDVYGGEYEFDNYIIKLHNHRGDNKGVSIRYGKNMTDLVQDENCSKVYSAVLPYWYMDPDEETGDGGLVVPVQPIKCEGTYEVNKVLILDLSSDFDTAPTIEQLESRAKKYIKDNDIGKPTVSLDVSFVQIAQSEEYKNFRVLENVHLCDTVNVFFEKLNVDSTAKCIKTVYDVITDRYSSIELGSAKSNLATSISQQNQTVTEDIATTKSSLEWAIENATKIITGGRGGYVVIHNSTGGRMPDEILIMDQPDINTAVEIWRWNKNGLGFSSNGYAGPFELAITKDGRIVADFITAGTFDGAIIKAGSIMGNMLNIEYHNAVTKQINDGDDSVTNEMTTLIQNTAEAITLLVNEVQTNLDNTKVELKASIKINSDAIEEEVTRATKKENDITEEYTSGLKINSDAIDAEVKRAIEAENGLSTSFTSSLKINSDAIEAEVKRAKGKETSIEASVKVNADNITTKVAKGEFGTYMRQNYNSFLLGFNGNEYGAVEIYSSGIYYYKSYYEKDTYIHIAEAGFTVYNDGIRIGNIWTNVDRSDPSFRTLTFDMDDGGKIMDWAVHEWDSSYNAYYYIYKLYYCRANTIQTKESINLGCPLQMHGYSTINTNLKAISTNGMLTTTKRIPVVTDISVSEDGELSWTTSEIVVRDGIMTMAPYGSKDIEEVEEV